MNRGCFLNAVRCNRCCAFASETPRDVAEVRVQIGSAARTVMHLAVSERKYPHFNGKDLMKIDWELVRAGLPPPCAINPPVNQRLLGTGPICGGRPYPVWAPGRGQRSG